MSNDQIISCDNIDTVNLETLTPNKYTIASVYTWWNYKPMYAKNLNSEKICYIVSLFFPKDIAWEIVKFLDILFKISYHDYAQHESYYELSDISNEIITCLWGSIYENLYNSIHFKMKIIMAITLSCSFNFINNCYAIDFNEEQINILLNILRSPIRNKIYFYYFTIFNNFMILIPFSLTNLVTKINRINFKKLLRKFKISNRCAKIIKKNIFSIIKKYMNKKKKSKFSKYFLCCFLELHSDEILIGLVTPNYLLAIKTYLDTIKPTMKYLNKTFEKNIMILNNLQKD
jgi:hypothetical protein